MGKKLRVSESRVWRLRARPSASTESGFGTRRTATAAIRRREAVQLNASHELGKLAGLLKSLAPHLGEAQRLGRATAMRRRNLTGL